MSEDSRRQKEQWLKTTTGKQAWLERELQAREQEYVAKSKVTVFVGTWNVNDQKPPESLALWLTAAEPMADIVAIGLQELDLTASALLAGETAKGKVWEICIIHALNAKGPRYQLLMSKQLAGMMLLVAVKREHMERIQDPRDCVVPVGILGMANKGAVSIRFQFDDSTFCFVNSHLCAHQANVLRRNQDFREIATRTQFSTVVSPPLSQSGAGSRAGGTRGMPRSSSFASLRELPSSSPKPVRVTNSLGSDVDVWTIYSHNHLFWLGDLNYRIDLSNDVLRSAISRSDWPLLRAADQLLIQKEQGQIFEGFLEGQLDFAPTYKYDLLSTNYDTSEKVRLPAWTDRILWKGDDIALSSYRRVELLTSDHRPVLGTFSVVVKTVIQAKREKIYLELVRTMDRIENESIPDVKVSEKELNFGDIEFNQPKSRTVVVRNIGHVPAVFRFVPRQDQKGISKPWLTITPSYGTIYPGDETALTVSIHVSSAISGPLTLKPEDMSDILILRLDRGKDEYLVVSANYHPSCFGCPLEHLIRFAGPVRTSKPFSETDDLLPLPKELWQLTDYLYHHGLKEPGLFLTDSTNPEDVEFVRRCLDESISLETFAGSVHSVAETLLLLLTHLPQSVIPQTIFDRCIIYSDSAASCFDIVKQLPPVYYNVFHYIMSFLRAILENQPAIHPEDLAIVFAHILLRPNSPKHAKNPDFEIPRRSQFLIHFLIPEVV